MSTITPNSKSIAQKINDELSCKDVRHLEVLTMQPETENIYAILSQNGIGRNLKEVKEQSERSENKRALENTRAKLELAKSQFSDNKIILYHDLMDVLSEYNLCLGNFNMYNKELPEQNAAELAAFYAKYHGKNYFAGNDGGPLFKAITTKRSLKESLYICAPIQDFVDSVPSILQGRRVATIKQRIGNEVFYDKDAPAKRFSYTPSPNPDPIIVAPFSYSSDSILLGFVVITAWDREAEDHRIKYDSHTSN